MVEAGLALVAALVAWSTTAALGVRALRGSRLYAGVWAAAAAAVAVALTAAVPAALLGFSPLTFRVFHIGFSLLGPLWLAWGALEFAYRSAGARFGNRLLVATLTAVPVLVFAMDPVRGQFGTGYPQAGQHYDLIPMAVLGTVHGFALLTLLVCFGAEAARRRELPEAARRRTGTVLLITVAVILQILVARLGLGPLGQLLAIAAVSCLLVGAQRAGRYDEPADHADYDGEWDDEEYADEEPDRGPGEEEPVRQGRRQNEPEAEEKAVHAGEAGAPRRSRMQGLITIYTLLEGHTADFDRLFGAMVEQVRRNEPDTLMFTCHTVARAPLQRIVYAVYRDELAHEEHGQRPYVTGFARDAAPFVLATNVIELSLASGKAEEALVDMLAVR